MAIAGIVAGGTGSRMGAGLPKQFLKIGSRTCLEHTVRAFLRVETVTKVIVGVHPEWVEEAAVLFSDERIFVIPGGAYRNETVRRIVGFALETLHCPEQEVLLTHDAVRPFVSEEVIRDSLRVIEHCDVCTAALPAVDTMVLSPDGQSPQAFPERSTVFHVQTPQTFRLGDFARLYDRLPEKQRQEATDVCRLFYDNAGRVMLSSGDRLCRKLTYPEDLEWARLHVSEL